MTVKKNELVAQAKKQPISRDICPFHHYIGTFGYLVCKTFHDHPVIIHLDLDPCLETLISAMCCKSVLQYSEY